MVKSCLYEVGEEYTGCFSNLELLMPKTKDNVTIYMYKDRSYNAHLHCLNWNEEGFVVCKDCYHYRF